METVLKEMYNGSYILILITFMIFIIPLIIASFHSRKTQPRRLPPGPRKLPIIGNIHRIVGSSLSLSLQHLSQQYGPLMMLQLGKVQAVVISSPQVLQDVFGFHDIVFSGKPAIHSMQQLTYGGLDLFAVSYGEHWRQAKKIAMSELFSTNRAKSFGSVRMEEVLDICASIPSAQGPIDFSKLMHSLVNNVIRRVTYGNKHYDKCDFYILLQDLTQVLGEVNIGDFLPWLSWINKFNWYDERLEKVHQQLDMFFEDVIQRKQEQSRHSLDSARTDLVGVLLGLQMDPHQTFTISKEHIKAILVDVLTGGTDTTLTILVWVMTELMKNPTTMRALQDELSKVANGKGLIEENDLLKLEHLHMAVKESFRLHPPFPLILRATMEDCKLRGYDIPANTMVFINVKMLGRDPGSWKDPNNFNPERFRNSSKDFKGHDFELIPFGSGRRGCPGINLATSLIELALANLLYRFDWNLPHGMSPDDIDMTGDLGFVEYKKVPLIQEASPRRA